MATIVSSIRSRPKHGAFVRLHTVYDDVSGGLSSLVLEQQGFEEHDFLVRFGERRTPLTVHPQKGGRFVIPIGDFTDERGETTFRKRPVELGERVREGKARVSTYDVSVRITLPQDFRSREGRLVWLERQAALARERGIRTGDMDAFRSCQYLQWLYGEHLKIFREGPRDLRLYAMADYTATGQVSWSQTGNRGSFNITLPADAAPCFMGGGFDWGGDTYGSTHGGNAQDDAHQADDDGDGAVITIHGDAATGSAQACTTTGLDAGDSHIGVVFGILEADLAAIATTGFPDTDSGTGDNPATTLTTVEGEVALASYEMFTFDADPAANLIAPQAGDTEIFEGGVSAEDSQWAGVYEKATGTSTAVGVTADAEGGFDQLVSAVAPTAEAASVFPMPHIQRMRQQ